MSDVKETRIISVKQSLTGTVIQKGHDLVARDYENTLRAHAYALSALGRRTRTSLPGTHRVAAGAFERGQNITYSSQFNDWIFTACEFSAAAERLLALEIELARSYGVTWEAMAAALGVSRQTAWGPVREPVEMAEEQAYITTASRSPGRAMAQWR